MRADALSTLAIGYVCVGQYDDALRTSADALALAERIENLWNRAFSRFATPFVHFDRGDWGTAIREWEEAVRLGREAGFIPVQIGPAIDLAWAYHCAGAADLALARAETVDALIAAHGDPGGFGLWERALHARIVLEQGDHEKAGRLLADRDIEGLWAVLPSGLAAVPYVLAEIELARGDLAAARDLVRRGLARLDELGYVPMIDELHWLEGNIEHRMGRRAEARAAFAKARAASDRLGAVRVLWRTLASLALIEDEDGDAAAADRLREEAARILRGIEASLRPIGLAERFAARPEVQALLGRTVAT
jgi:tetratricopeptide (TPR) repeat protein